MSEFTKGLALSNFYGGTVKKKHPVHITSLFDLLGIFEDCP